MMDYSDELVDAIQLMTPAKVPAITGDELTDARLMRSFAIKMKEALELGENCELRLAVSDKGFMSYREIGFPEVHKFCGVS
jgi:hypothetical protein